jgi:hypothetical protein
LFPTTEHAPFDLVAYDGEAFYRVQVKYRTVYRGVLLVHFRSVWADRHGVHQQPMEKRDVDVVAVYSPEVRTCFYLDPSDHGASVALRLDEPVNGQRSRVLMASSFTSMPPRSPAAGPTPGGSSL